MKVSELSKMIVGLTVWVLASVPAYSLPAMESGGQACCICLAAVGRDRTTAPTACNNVDWGDRCPADKQFVCSMLDRQPTLCLKNNEWVPMTDVFQADQCNSLTAIINAQDIDESGNDGTLKAANMCMHALYAIEGKANAWIQCVNFLGSCNADDGREFAYTCARVREASKFRKEYPSVPEEVFTITKDGLKVSPDCLSQLDAGRVGGGTYKFTVKKGGEVAVTVCENTVCSEKGFNDVCPSVAVKVTVHVKPNGGCSPCDKLKEFLKSKQIDFSVVNGGTQTFPVTILSVEGEVKETIQGFASEEEQGKKIFDAWIRLTYPIQQGGDKSQ